MRKLFNQLITRRSGPAPAPSPERADPVSQLLRGELRPDSSHPTLLFFTVHKGASSFAGHLLRTIALTNGIAALDLEQYLHSTVPDEKERHIRDDLGSVLGKGAAPPKTSELANMLQALFLPRGCLYSPLRHSRLLLYLPGLGDFQAIIMLRDPRDCLTSLFYSVAYSHRPPGNPERLKEFQYNRQRALQQGIDKFVLRHATSWLVRYQTYCDALHQHPNTHLLKYEQFVADFPGWLEQVTSLWGVQIDSATRHRLMEEADFSTSGEDVYSHKRQVQPGDHLRKLQPQTIRELNALLQPVLAPLGYPLDAGDAKVA